MTRIANTLQRKLVWPGKLRLAHWGIAISVLALIITAWLLEWAPTVAQAASDYHYIFGALLTVSLIGRGWLLLMDKTVGGWKALLPTSTSIQKSLEMLRFYFSFGNTPLPGWYAHNPLWLPVYAVVILSLATMAATGMIMGSSPIVLGIYLPALHEGLAGFITLFTFAHIAAVIFHDVRGKQSDVSGILNGYRIFEMEGLDVGPGEKKLSQISVAEVKKYSPDE